VLHELRTDPKELISKIDREKFINRSYFMQQVREGINEGKIAAVNPLHFLMNIISLYHLSFCCKPILQNIGGLKQQDFNVLMEERKKLIPAMDKSNDEEK
jgi:hypothetical protein